VHVGGLFLSNQPSRPLPRTYSESSGSCGGYAHTHPACASQGLGGVGEVCWFSDILYRSPNYFAIHIAFEPCTL
jgi:hypothetical protein